MYSNFIQLRFVLIVLFFYVITSCEVIDNNTSEENNFQKIYTLNDGDTELFPLDIVEIENEQGFLILSALTDSLASVFPRVHILKLNASGQNEWQLDVDPKYYGPVRNIANINNNYDVFCMKENQQTCVLRINVNDASINEIADFDIQLPLHVAVLNGKDILVTSYNRFGNQTDIVKLNQQLQHEWTQSFSVGTDEDIMEVNIFNFVKQEKDYPFFAQTVKSNNENYFAVNCFSNYTLSMHYLQADDGSLKGKINGYQLTGYVSAAQHVTDTTLFLGYAHTGKFYVPEMKQPETGTFVNIENLEGVYYPEILPDKTVDALVYPDTDKPDQLVLGINNGNGKPELFVYDSPDFNLSQTIPIQQHYPAEIKKIRTTSDGGIIALMQVQYANYLPRISLVKVPKDALK